MDKKYSNMQLVDNNVNTSLRQQLEEKDAQLNNIDKTFALAEAFVNKSYLLDIQRYCVNNIQRSVREATAEKTVKLYKITSLVSNKNENVLDKLNNVYGALHNLGISLINLIISNGSNVDFYLGIKVNDDNKVTDNIGDLFVKSFRGNFPGSQLSSVKPQECNDILKSILSQDGDNAITSLTSIPSLKNNDYENGEYIQGIEKMIDTMNGEKYGVIIISDPVNSEKLKLTKRGYEELYSVLSSLAEYEMNIGSSDSVSISISDTEGLTKTVGSSISKTQSFNKGKSITQSESKSNTLGIGLGLIGSIGQSQSFSETSGLGWLTAMFAITKAMTSAAVSGINQGVGANLGLNASTTKTTGSADTNSFSEQHGFQKTEQDSESFMKQHGVQEGNTQSTTSSTNIRIENKSMKILLESIDSHLKRMKECENYGMWSTAAYFVAPSKETSIMVASAYKGIINGENSSLEISCMNTWYKDDKVRKINQYLSRFIHPKFHHEDYLVDFDALTEVSVATMINTKELAIQCNIPYKSICGLSVREGAEFGRNIYSIPEKNKKYQMKSLRIGSIYHMGEVEKDSVVELDIERLKEHTFITGSTGSGKSNTVYSIIDGLTNEYSIPTLIIEPAKGEYKQVFGDSYNVFGTNPRYTEILKINPFKFESEIHVLEHIDRLIDIFNVCWPMYAAMPAVLKEAIERAYISCGWLLDKSENIYNNNIFPCFKDILRELRNVINESDYSQEVKDNYTGSLITRVKSLTNGLNGQIFINEEVDSTVLFNENTIIDLSRVGSSETKSMIMGIIIMRLQEYRMSRGGINLPLNHITVIEEAHNLLKRTSTEQSSETSNLIGKSVEMISNAIAEMRTYGEGFIIVDQAPGLLDMSVIRNTNTKIILRLPDFTDRELVGKSAGLNEDQIGELTKIPSGVSAIYQNKWNEPILCQVDYFDHEPKEYVLSTNNNFKKTDKIIKEEVIQYLLSDISKEIPENDLETLKQRLIASTIESGLKVQLLQCLERKKPQSLEEVWGLVAECIENIDNIFAIARKAHSVAEWNEMIIEGINFEMCSMSTICQLNILECVIKKKSLELEGDDLSYTNWRKYMRRGEGW